MFRAWKLHTMLFTIAITLELIIVPYFWTALYPGHCIKWGQEIEGWPMECWPMFLDHSVPLGCLLIDYFMNVTPLVWRHVVILLCFGVGYLSINCGVTLGTGHPVYKTMDWQSVGGILTPLCMLIAAPLFFFVLVQLNILKLRLTDHPRMAKLCMGKKDYLSVHSP